MAPLGRDPYTFLLWVLLIFVKLEKQK